MIDLIRSEGVPLQCERAAQRISEANRSGVAVPLRLREMLLVHQAYAACAAHHSRHLLPIARRIVHHLARSAALNVVGLECLRSLCVAVGVLSRGEYQGVAGHLVVEDLIVTFFILVVQTSFSFFFLIISVPNISKKKSSHLVCCS